jgi:hypothetical protein
VADSQVDLARVAEQHVQETSRTARTLADEVARAASEETQHHLRTQENTIRNFRDPFQHGGANGSVHRGNLQSGTGAEGGVQSSMPVGQQGKSAAKAG